MSCSPNNMAVWPVGLVAPARWQYGLYVFLGRCWPQPVMPDISPYGRRPGAPSRLRPSRRSGHTERRHTGPLGRHCCAPYGVLASTGPLAGEPRQESRTQVWRHGHGSGQRTLLSDGRNTVGWGPQHLSTWGVQLLWGHFWNMIFCVTELAMSDAGTVSAGALLE